MQWTKSIGNNTQQKLQNILPYICIKCEKYFTVGYKFKHCSRENYCIKCGHEEMDKWYSNNKEKPIYIKVLTARYKNRVKPGAEDI